MFRRFCFAEEWTVKRQPCEGRITNTCNHTTKEGLTPIFIHFKNLSLEISIPFCLRFSAWRKRFLLHYFDHLSWEVFLIGSSTLNIKRVAWDIVSANSTRLRHSYQSCKSCFVLLAVLLYSKWSLYPGRHLSITQLLTHSFTTPCWDGGRLGRVKVRKLVVKIRTI